MDKLAVSSEQYSPGFRERGIKILWLDSSFTISSAKYELKINLSTQKSWISFHI